MKVLFISNYYPPIYIGGYELRCKDIADFLQRNGHDVSVMTSRSKSSYHLSERKVYRQLYLTDLKKICRCDILNNIIREWCNIRALNYIIRKTKPDLVFIWNLAGVGKSLLLALERRNIPLAYYIEDDWIYRGIKEDFWSSFCEHHFRAIGWPGRWVATLLNRVVPYRFESWRPSNIRYVSHFIKQKAIDNGLNVPDSAVLYPGVPILESLKSLRPPIKDGPIAFLYAGQINRLKGVFTLLDAYSLFVAAYGRSSLLTLVGEISDRDKVHFEKKIMDPLIKNTVRYLGKLSREEVREVCWENDVLIFPSEREEGMPLILAEAMTCQMAILSTPSGGASEMITDGYNALLFQAGNEKDLCSQMLHVSNDEKLRRRLADNAFDYAQKYFSLDRMGQEVELFLKRICSGDEDD